MDSDPTTESGPYARVRLHILSWPTGADAPTAAWVMELSDVDWRPADGWRSEIQSTVSDAQDAADQVTSYVEDGAQGSVLNIVARTTRGTAQIIGDRHRASALLGEWAEPRDGSTASDQHHTSEAVAREAVLLVLEAHFGLDTSAIDSVAVDFEPGDELFVHVAAGASRYLGTVTRQGGAQVSHVVHQREADTDQGGMDAG